MKILISDLQQCTYMQSIIVFASIKDDMLDSAIKYEPKIFFSCVWLRSVGTGSGEAVLSFASLQWRSTL